MEVFMSEEQINIQDYHNLKLDDQRLELLINNPNLVGLSDDDIRGKTRQQRIQLIIGEYFAKVALYAGQLASVYLYKARWGYVAPEWFDHRHHFLYPEMHFNDFWTISADNIIPLLPLNGKLLDMCSGDGFYDYYYYRKRCQEITCIELDQEAYRQALRLHQAENIDYKLESVLDYEPLNSYFDVVMIRGAIEHFSEENQQIIFRKALKSLKVGGWFCGDTVANSNKSRHPVLLVHHEYEWADEIEMRQQLDKVFDYVETYTVESRERITLLWRCQKTK